MEPRPPHNIFDEAGKSKLKPKLLPKKEIIPPKVEMPKGPHIPITDTEIQGMFDRMNEMRNDLDKRTDDLKEAIALSQKDVIKFFSESKNFTPEQWNIIQENRTDLEKRTWAVVGKDPNKVREKHLEDKDAKLRKGKTLGSRKNWIPIR